MLGPVHHIGYRVNDLEKAIADYQKLFDAPIVRRGTSPTGVPIAFLQMGAVQVELIQGYDQPGQVMDHVAYQVDNLDAILPVLKAKGAQFESAAPVVSGTGARFMFVNQMGSRLQLYQT